MAALASVTVSSEQSLFPIDNVFDGRGGPGGSCWVAADAGAQTVVLAFDAPHALRSVHIEAEEHSTTRTQQVTLSTSRDNAKTYDASPTRQFTFSPYGATFERETWDVALDGVTHVRMEITPDHTHEAGEPARACLTSVVLR